MPRACPVVPHVRCYSKRKKKEGFFFLPLCSNEPNQPRGKPVGFEAIMVTRRQVWRYVRALAAPLLLWVLFLIVLIRLLPSWLRGDESYDQKAMHEWLDEAAARDNLPSMVRDYLDAVADWRRRNPTGDPSGDSIIQLHPEKIQEHLKSLGDPPTKMYPGQLILFPTTRSAGRRLGVRHPATNVATDRARQHHQPRCLHIRLQKVHKVFTFRASSALGTRQ